MIDIKNNKKMQEVKRRIYSVIPIFLPAIYHVVYPVFLPTIQKPIIAKVHLQGL